MAKITFTADDGTTQDFDLGVLTAPVTEPTITDVEVKESDGTTEDFTEGASAPAA